MKVSVIVPTFRRDWELKRALQSLAVQDFAGFEIIVVDDNVDADWSNTVQNIISEIRQAHPTVELRYVQNQEKKGAALSRNVGVEAAAGEYITFLDDDDEYLQGKISRQYAFMEQQKLDYSITDLDLYFVNGKLCERRLRSYLREDSGRSLLENHFMYHMTGTDTIMLKKAYFDEIGGFPPIDLGDEFYLMKRAIEHEGAFGYLEGCDVKAYVHTGDGGLSSGEGKIRGENRLYEYKKKYFHQLSPKSIRYIKMRHYAVLSFAGLRMHHYGYFLRYGIQGFLSAPIQCVGMLLDQQKEKGMKNQGEKISV